MKILAIGSHPDDIEIFMFGFLSACLQRGDDICLCVATDGSLGGENPGLELTKIRSIEAEKGLKHLGQPIFLNFKDGNLNDEIGALKKIKELINDSKPDLIVTHAPEDYHPDHRTLSEYVKSVVGFKCPLIYADTLLGVNFIPEIYIDITKYFNLKKKAILCHKSQNPKKFFEAVEIMNRYRAAQCNAPRQNYAEAFRFEKTFPFSDIRNLLPAPPPYRPFYKKLKNALI
jgi:N-acetylglucosamine malate deacetylase 1